MTTNGIFSPAMGQLGQRDECVSGVCARMCVACVSASVCVCAFVLGECSEGRCCQGQRQVPMHSSHSLLPASVTGERGKEGADN